jgi:predicted TIM-barrel fold metal-dependent hydrolase
MFWQPVLQFVYSVLGADRILFAVDYPHESNRAAVKFMEAMSVCSSDKEKIYHLSAETLLAL